MIKADGLNKFYNKGKSNEIHVVNDVSIELPNQGLVSFLGASGSGKTTLLNVIGGLDKASGTICYDSFEMKKYEMTKVDKYRNENIGYVFQSYNLLSEETVYNNLKIALELINIYDEREASCRIEYALKSVGLYKYRKKRASQLSGGQQQRVAIARALIKHCKVIIADEPTGNLDSANAVEVMNILKSLSKKTLVLLVTHNEQLADFYSDYIYRIEDGKIVDKRENVSNTSLNTANDNIIYLKDMKLTELNSESIGVKLYSDTEKSIELEIVERNNTFYLKSNKNIKLVENSNIKLVDDHYKPVERKEASEYDYDDSFFNNSVKSKNVFKDILSSFKRSFLSFIAPTKKVRAIYISMVLIGVLFSICAVSISNAVGVNTGSINADPSYSTLSNGIRYYYVDDSEVLEKALKDKDISSVQIVYGRYVDFEKKTNYVETKKFSTSYSRIYYNDKVNTLLCGREPSNNEVAISRGIADELLMKFGEFCETYEDLFELSCNSGSEKIVGVVDNPNKMMYVSEKTYVDYATDWIHVSEDHYRYYDIEKKYDSYEIVLGRDLTDEDKNTDNVLISEQFPEYSNMIGQNTYYGNVVGVYRMKSIQPVADEVIINQNYTLDSDLVFKYSYNVEDYTLTDGREPQNDSECLVSVYSSYEIGDDFQGYDIVGKYNASIDMVRANVLLSTSALSIDEYSNKVFAVEDEEGFLKTLNGEYELKNYFDHEYDQMKDLNNEKMTVFLILGSICLIAASIMVFFLMRSKMINDIYNIGVYRSLGSSKYKIYLKYFTDTVTMATLTSFISYVAVTLITVTAMDSINDTLGTELLHVGLGIPFVGIFVLYAVNIIFGLLPIFTLLGKTPSEILAKYDI